MEKNKICLLVCRNFAREAAAAVKAEELTGLRIATFPARCNLPSMCRDVLEPVLDTMDDSCDEIHLLGGGCLTGSKLPESKPGNLHVHRMEPCFAMFAGREIVDRYIGGNAFLLTPGWLEHWRGYLDQWGLDRQTAREFFAESLTELVLLDTGGGAETHARLEEFADFTGLPFRIVPVGLDLFRLHLVRIVLERRLAKEKSESEKLVPAMQRQLADYAMATDLIGSLTEVMTEEKAVEQIIRLFRELFAPARLNYLSITGGKPRTLHSYPSSSESSEDTGKRLLGLGGDYAWTDSENGFLLRIRHQQELLGLLEVSQFAFPQYREHYLNLALVLANVCGLAIANARRYQMLQAERDRAQRYLDVAGVILTMIGADGKVGLINRKGCAVLGYPEEEIIGKNWFDHFIPERIRDEMKAGFIRFMAGDLEPMEYHENPVLTKKGEERIIAWHNTVLRDDRGRITASLSSGEDITERKRAEASLQARNQDLEAFAYTAAHDLQEPLRTITGYLQLLKKRCGEGLDDEARDFIGFAVDGAVRMQSLINSLLSYSRVGTQGKSFEPVNVEEILKQALMNLESALAESGASVTHDPLPVVPADDRQLVQLFQNLIANAVQYRSEAPPEIHVGVRRKAEGWLFSLRDNGMGFDMKYADKIFGVFQRLHSGHERPGAGIGLAIVKKIVERHHGRIWVESAPGKGTVFFFTLPRHGLL